MSTKFQRTGDVLRRLRLKNELTQAELGKRIGIHVQFVSNYERGLCMPPKNSLKKLSKALEMKSTDKAEILEALMEDRFQQTVEEYAGLV